MMRYVQAGKQVLVEIHGQRSHFADARDAEAAGVIVAALNRPVQMTDGPREGTKGATA